jgi:hypothetical protein
MPRDAGARLSALCPTIRVGCADTQRTHTEAQHKSKFGTSTLPKNPPLGCVRFVCQLSKLDSVTLKQKRAFPHRKVNTFSASPSIHLDPFLEFHAQNTPIKTYCAVRLQQVKKYCCGTLIIQITLTVVFWPCLATKE